MDFFADWFLAVGLSLMVIFFMAFYLGRSEKHSPPRKGLPYYRYLALIHEHEGHYSLSFPDFPECDTVAEDLAGLYVFGQEVLLFQIESVLEEGGDLPAPTPPLRGYPLTKHVLLENDQPEPLGFWVLRVERPK